MTEFLSYLGIDPSRRLDVGGKTEMYELDSERVVRVHAKSTPESIVWGRTALLAELGTKSGRVPFAIPKVIEVVSHAGRFASIEARLPGEVMISVLARAQVDRRKLVRSYLNASRQIGELTPERSWYGDLLREESIHTLSFLEYSLARAHDSLRRGGERYQGVSELKIADDLGEAPKSLVHMEFFPGNVLVEGEDVVAVLDFGESAIIGDRRLDPIGAAVYLDPHITPSATDEDRDFASTWLRANELHTRVESARQWLAAFWAASIDDAGRDAWCEHVLLGS